MGKVIGIIVLLEVVAGTAISLYFFQDPMAPLIVTGCLVLTTIVMIPAVYVSKYGNISSGYSHYPIRSWMRTNEYFNSQEMRRDVDRIAQLSEERAIRERMDL